ncbi:Gfo/Idh/MocA family oxidoreductase [Rhodothermus profundi]|uniref:UDP-N-acetyl-2-amino-2-deoxyglucuronate dehydrogenase n=1 Tax=Rhodothermus profundi TaxID=633813 RepID=A0A1M6V8A4_9BACT|nr:Gfo/Idh/MocA family oxidoreductase [Rhodothermus profundi]SHK77699.1 UDP-N-acetyl-2-amino-2-deoxyglucuronate dehydrogenase [Rhodothermus profundi]
MKRFALTGVAGYIAPRHLQAMREVGGKLVAALDVVDAVGVLDRYFPEALFFLHPELFEAHLEDLRDRGEGVDYVSVCVPNYLHGAHVRMAFRVGADALCEKPLVLEPSELVRLRELEARWGRRVWTVLQLRVHPALVRLREQLQGEGGIKEVELTYITGRGPWYLQSWKGREELSGGVAMNIGVHFFDLLHWLFGALEHAEVHVRTATTWAGRLELERARVRWFLSIDARYVPEALRRSGQRTYRSIRIEGEEVEFSGGFTELHTEVYRRTLAGQGFGIAEATPAIETIARLRRLEVVQAGSNQRHPLVAV